MKQLPPITKNLLIINAICFLAQLVAEQRGTDLADYLGLHFILASDFEPWQMVTYMFLHANFTHLFFNMFSLWMFGRIVEQTMKPSRFLLFYFVCGIGAGLCQEVWQLADYYLSGIAEYARTAGDFATVAFNDGTHMPLDIYLNQWTTIGASGACYGVLLAFGMTFPNERIMLLIPPIPIKAKYFVVGYAAIELLSAYTSNDNVAHFAHLGGMLFGLLLILYWRRRDRRGGNRGFRGWETWTPGRSRSFSERLKDRWNRFASARTNMKIQKGGKRWSTRDAAYGKGETSKEQQARVDEILEKVRRNGYQSLTDEEKKTLFDKSKK